MLTQEWTDSGSFLQYEGLEIKCPKCNSEDVVLEYDDGFVSFYECNKCKYKKGK